MTELAGKAAYDGGPDGAATPREACLPEPYYADELVTLYHGDCREILPALPDDSVDLVVTDPPYSAETHNLDVASPVGGPLHVPCDRYYTAADDGLTQPWDGLVWCNPPYSRAVEWATRWACHPTGVFMGQVASRQPWRALVYDAADAVYIGQVEFSRPDGRVLKFGWTPIMVAFRGVGVGPAERLAAADRFGGVLYGRHEEAS